MQKPIHAGPFYALEQSLMSASVTASPDRLDALLADDFAEFGRSGRVYDKASVIAGLLAAPKIADEALPPLLDFAAHPIAEDVVLVTYRMAGSEPGGGALRSSLWVKAAGHWRLRFHQGTPL